MTEEHLKHSLPSHSDQIVTILMYELRKLFRSKRVIGIIILAFLASVALDNLILSSPMNTSDPTALFSGFILYSPILVVIAATLIGSDMLLSEFHEKTGYSLFPNPVSRVAIWFGKFFAGELIMFTIVAIFFGVLSIAMIEKFQQISAPTLIAPVLFSFLFATFVLAIAFLASSVFRGPIGAMATVLFSLFFMPVLDQLMASQMIQHWFTPFSVVNYTYAIILGVPNQGGIFFGPFSPDPQLGIAITLPLMVAYIVVPSIGSIYIFRRREM